MININTSNLTYNDTNEIRLFASDEFNWYLQKQTGVACSWGKTIKQTPEYDPIGPQEILWHITDFNLQEYLKKFIFLANIRKLQNNQIIMIDQTQNIFQNKKNYICVSTLTNIIIIIDTFNNINIQQLAQFCQYIRYFNINVNIQYNLTDYQNIDIYKQIYKISCNLILNISSQIFTASKLLSLLNNLKQQFNISIKLHVNQSNNIQLSKFIDKLENNLNCIIYIQKPYFSVRKYLNLQTKILSKKLTNICLSQCCKHYYSKNIIGSIIMQLPCSACRYTLYLKDLDVYDCEINKNKICSLYNTDTLDKIWNNEHIINLRTKLIDTNKC